jgi:hypothetical protein
LEDLPASGKLVHVWRIYPSPADMAAMDGFIGLWRFTRFGLICPPKVDWSQAWFWHHIKAIQ